MNVRILAPATLALLAGCAGAAHFQPEAKPVATLPEGVWQGDLLDTRTGQSSKAVAIVLASGAARVTTATRQVAAQVNAGLGTGTVYALDQPTPGGGLATTALSLLVNQVSPRARFSGQSTTAGTGLRFEFTYLASYDTATALADLAGTYTAAAADTPLGVPLTLAVAADGSFTATDPLGIPQVTGSLAVADPARTGLTCTLQVGGPGSTPRAMAGLGTFLPGDPAGLYLAAASTDQAFQGKFTR